RLGQVPAAAQRRGLAAPPVSLASAPPVPSRATEACRPDVASAALAALPEPTACVAREASSAEKRSSVPAGVQRSERSPDRRWAGSAWASEPPAELVRQVPTERVA